MSETFGRESLNRENSSYIIIIDEIGGRVCRRFLVLLFFLRGWKMIAVQLPEHWRDWILKEELGRGSFGVVYRAERKLGEDTFSSAIKVIRIPDSEQEKNAVLLEITDEESRKKYYADTAASFMKEIKTMAQLRGNSYIVSIEDYDVVHDAENVQWTIFIRMEFLESFRSYQISNEIDDELVVRLGIDICHALSLCEEKGIVHRDIKPDNIFIPRQVHLSWEISEPPGGRNLREVFILLREHGAISLLKSKRIKNMITVQTSIPWVLFFISC